jgi:hypothetical protein
MWWSTTTDRGQAPGEFFLSSSSIIDSLADLDTPLTASDRWYPSQRHYSGQRTQPQRPTTEGTTGDSATLYFLVFSSFSVFALYATPSRTWTIDTQVTRRICDQNLLLRCHPQAGAPRVRSTSLCPVSRIFEPHHARRLCTHTHLFTPGGGNVVRIVSSRLQHTTNTATQQTNKTPKTKSFLLFG